MLEKTGKTPFYARGLKFSCIRCSACCRYESGYVFLSKIDASSLGEALNMGYMDFVRTYCRWIPGDHGKERLSLREKSNYDCIFWKDGCAVYDARPLQCRSYPFWRSVLTSADEWQRNAGECPGAGNGVLHSYQSIENWLARRQSEPVIERTVDDRTVEERPPIKDA